MAGPGNSAAAPHSPVRQGLRSVSPSSRPAVTCNWATRARRAAGGSVVGWLALVLVSLLLLVPARVAPAAPTVRPGTAPPMHMQLGAHSKCWDSTQARTLPGSINRKSSHCTHSPSMPCPCHGCSNFCGHCSYPVAISTLPLYTRVTLPPLRVGTPRFAAEHPHPPAPPFRPPI